MRIFYAAGNREGSYSQLKRYLPLLKKSGHEFKVAGYQKSIKNLSADYCLDALLNFLKPKDGSFNGNFAYYGKELEKFKPDLVLSDLEVFTSLHAIEYGFPLWQIGPALLYYGLSDSIKRATGIGKFNHTILGSSSNQKHITRVLQYSQRKLIISHLCDIKEKPELITGYEWCRPEFQLSEGPEVIRSNGTGISLADAFYNQQYALLNLLESDIETVPGVYSNVYFGLGQLEDYRLDQKKIDVNVDNKIKFLMEMI